MMDITRNQFFFAGLACLLLGLQFRMIDTVELTPEWYGFDPIHIKPTCWPTAWHEILRGWSDAEAAPLPTAGGWDVRRWLYLLSLAPERRSFLGVERCCKQPCGKLSEGTVLSYY